MAACIGAGSGILAGSVIRLRLSMKYIGCLDCDNLDD